MDDRTRQKLHAALDRYRDGAPANARSYPDLHEHVLALARENLLVVVDEPINKDTEMHPLVRWQYRGGIPEPDRKAFLFTQPTDSKGRRYDAAVLVAGLAANRAVYRTGFGKPLEDIGAAWVNAIANPIPPRVVENAPCQEIVITGKDLDKDGQALDGLPVPISTPGWDNAPYLSAGHYITKDPDSGVQNVGNYRGQLKAPKRLGMNPSVELRAGIYAHWEKYKARGEPMPCAVVVGCPPVVSYASVQKLANDLDELAVAGAIAGGPDQCRALQDRRPAGAGGSRDRDRGPDQHRAAGAGSAVRRIPRLRQSAGIQRLHGRHRDHAAAQSDPHLLHQPGDAERVRA